MVPSASVLSIPSRQAHSDLKVPLAPSASVHSILSPPVPLVPSNHFPLRRLPSVRRAASAPMVRSVPRTASVRHHLLPFPPSLSAPSVRVPRSIPNASTATPARISVIPSAHRRIPPPSAKQHLPSPASAAYRASRDLRPVHRIPSHFLLSPRVANPHWHPLQQVPRPHPSLPPSTILRLLLISRRCAPVRMTRSASATVVFPKTPFSISRHTAAMRVWMQGSSVMKAR